MTDYTNRLLCGDSADILKTLDSNLVDLTITSPPYDDLRSYGEYIFDFQTIAKELFRVTKEGGVLVWVVKDSVEEGSETFNSFKQAIFFKDVGFKAHDTMIYQLDPRFPEKTRYRQEFEYMFVFSKGIPKTFNPIKDIKSKHFGRSITANNRKDNQLTGTKEVKINEFHERGNIWYIKNGYMKSSKDKIAYEHPAIFPEDLAKDHIISWSNEGDLVLDPMMGSGTTYKMAKMLKRNFIGIEINEKYLEIAKQRCSVVQEVISD